MTIAPNMATGVMELVAGFHVLIAASCARCGASVVPKGAPDECYVIECPCDGSVDSVVVMLTGVEVMVEVTDEPKPERPRPRLVALDGGLSTRKDPTR